MHAEVFSIYALPMGTDFSVIGRLLAAPARSAMLDLMMGGTAHPAGELAAAAGVVPSTASEHLAALVEGGLVTVRISGRHRYYALAGAQVAGALEAIGQLCPATPVRSLRQNSTRESLRLARTCYDHLAGRLGVELHDAMVRARWLDEDTSGLTSRGRAGLMTIGIDVEHLQAARRPLTRRCLDWTERRSHLAGSAGAAIADTMLARRWVVRQTGGRGLRIGPCGATAIRDVFGLDVASWTTVARRAS